MSRYASQTSVSITRSRDEIEKILTNYGADQFVYGWEEKRAFIQFRAEQRSVRFLLVMPDEQEFALTPTGQRRSADAKTKAWEQANRQRWRALKMVIQAKLEAVESGITEFEAEFLAHVVLPDGTTVGDWVQPQVALAYDSADMPKGLPWTRE